MYHALNVLWELGIEKVIYNLVNYIISKCLSQEIEFHDAIVYCINLNKLIPLRTIKNIIAHCCSVCLIFYNVMFADLWGL